MIFPSSIVYGFGTRIEPIPAVLRLDWETRAPRWNQVHGKELVEVLNAAQDCGDVDALYTFKRAIPIAVRTADCVPILLARKDGAGIAAVHAGWRGTRAEILCALGVRLKQKGENLQNWNAIIGPAIGPCCYEVSEDLARDFSEHFSSMAAVPAHRKLDLPTINATLLARQGFGEVHVIRECTHCSMNAKGSIYCSFRREQGTDRQWSGLMIS